MLFILGVIALLAMMRPIPKFLIDREVSQAMKGAVPVREFTLKKYEQARYPKSFYDLAFDEDRYYFVPHDRLGARPGALVKVYRSIDGVYLCIEQDCVFPIRFCWLDADKRLPVKCERNAERTISTWFEMNVRPWSLIWW